MAVKPDDWRMASACCGDPAVGEAAPAGPRREDARFAEGGCQHDLVSPTLVRDRVRTASARQTVSAIEASVTMCLDSRVSNSGMRRLGARRSSVEVFTRRRALGAKGPRPRMKGEVRSRRRGR